MRIFNNFWRSIQPSFRKSMQEGGGVYVGQDLYGTKYFERPAAPEHGRKYPLRYFEVTNGEDYVRENLPAEWDSWLRLRRRRPPSPEEERMNLQIARMKKENALRKGLVTPDDPTKSRMHDFPVHKEYEFNPGVKKVSRDEEMARLPLDEQNK